MKRFASLVAVGAMFGACGAFAQEAPRPGVRYQAPTTSLISAHYVCGAPVSLTIETTQYSMRVARFAAGERQLDEENLRRWNDSLAEIADFSFHQFSCVGTDFLAVSITGRTKSLEEVIIVVEWRQGRFFIDRLTPGNRVAGGRAGA